MRRLLCVLSLVLLSACTNSTGGGSVGTEPNDVPTPSSTPAADLSTGSATPTP